MHKIGDIVRLKRGWTPMVVIGINENNGHVLACYCQGHYDPIAQYHYDNPKGNHHYARPQSGFVVWDGSPLTREVYKPMPTRYKTIQNNGTPEFGRLLVVDGNNFVLKMDNGEIREFPQGQLTEDIPFTFSVKAIGNHRYTCDYTVPFGVHIKVKDLLLSDSGNVYFVTALDTKCRNPKGNFSGSRLEKTPL